MKNIQKKLTCIGLTIIIIMTLTTGCGQNTIQNNNSNPVIATAENAPSEVHTTDDLDTPVTDDDADYIDQSVQETNATLTKQENLEEKAKAAMETLEVWDGSIAESFDGGDGSAENPYQIANGAQLAKLASDTNQGIGFANTHFILTSDIVLNNIGKWDFNDISNNYDLYYGGWNNWHPIGAINGNDESGYQFRGVFDGCGKTIFGLYSSHCIGGGQWRSFYATGLFGGVYKGNISNVNLACGILYPEFNSYTPGNIGGIVGKLEYGTIENCHTQQILINGAWCYSETDNSDVDTYIGGICGCTLASEISDSSTEGLLVCRKGLINEDGTAIGYRDLYIGGIVGNAYSENSSIRNCFSSCDIIISSDITATKKRGSSINEPGIYAGGICGLLNSPHDEEGKIAYCYSNEKMDIRYTNEEMGEDVGIIAGIVGYAYGTTSVINCCYNQDYSSNETRVVSAVGASSHFEGTLFTDQIKSFTEEELCDDGNYYGWDFDSIWIIDSSINGGLPMLRSLSPYYVR